ncbi:MAG: hypothetical protein ABUS48_06755 [Pseudomonadota bacterium]
MPYLTPKDGAHILQGLGPAQRAAHREERTPLIRVSAFFAAVVGLSACLPIEPSQPSSTEQAAVESIVGAYSFGAAEASLVGCRVTLEATPVGRADGHTTRSVSLSSACGEHFPALRAVRQWVWTGGGGIAFFGSQPSRELSDFSPVQDATGVYLRGGFEGDAGVYELRRQEP